MKHREDEIEEEALGPMPVVTYRDRWQTKAWELRERGEVGCDRCFSTVEKKIIDSIEDRQEKKSIFFSLQPTTKVVRVPPPAAGGVYLVEAKTGYLPGVGAPHGCTLDGLVWYYPW